MWPFRTLRRLYRWLVAQGDLRTEHPSMTCENPEHQPIRRCATCNLTYAADNAFKRCAQCGQETQALCVLPDTLEDHRPPTKEESLALQSSIYREKAATNLAAQQRETMEQEADRLAAERTVAGAVASLHYDLDRWLSVTVEELTEWMEDGRLLRSDSETSTGGDNVR